MIRLLKKQDVPFLNMVRNECSRYLHDKSTHTLEEAYDWFDNYYNGLFFMYGKLKTISKVVISVWTYIKIIVEKS